MTIQINDKISKLKQQLTNVHDKGQSIEHEMQEEYNKLFEKDEYIRKAISQLEVSNFYGYYPNWDEIAVFEQFELKEYEDCLDYLEVYLEDNYSIHLDKKEGYIFQSAGYSIIINDDGDIYDEDSRKWIIGRKEYATIEERNALIEAYMEESGYFPNVFRVDNYGNVKLINTLSK